jgi:hypothetical protein
MQMFLLDVVDAGSYDNGLWRLIAVVLCTIFVEMAVMRLMKYNNWKKSLLDAAIVNVASVSAGMLIVQLAPDLFNDLSIINLLKLFLITLVIETAILQLLNRNKVFKKTALVSLVMNLTSYILYTILIVL